uniref:Transposase (putative) gypsy type domain-containing protein n=1 Tax=Fagus sylvatica TaxID=28930 RepID=A0A2N9IT32_FAGSY
MVFPRTYIFGTFLYGDLALLQRQDLVLPIVAIVEGGVRIPMHTFLLRFLTHFRLNPLQCAPNVFRIVMGTAVLMEKLGLNLTVHDITYVYSLQTTGRDQYTLVARNVDRKLVTGLPDSSKGRDEDFLVFTGNWQNPHINCPLRPGVPDKEFTAKKVELVERKTVEHLLKRPCFIDSAGRPRAASILLDYEEVTVVRPGKDQEDIIQALPVTARRGVQVPQLVPPLSNPEFVPSLESSEVGLPVIRFPSFFDPDPKPTEEMPVQKRSVNIASVLGTSAPETSGTSPRASSPVPPPWVCSRRGCYEEEKKERKRSTMMTSASRKGSSPSRLPKAKAPKKGKSKNDRALQKATGQVSQRLMHQDDSKQPWSCTFLLENRPVDEGDSVLKSGKGVRGGEVAEAVGKGSSPSRRHEGLAGEEVQAYAGELKAQLHPGEPFKVYLRLVTDFWRPNVASTSLERKSNVSQDFEKSASAKIRAAESAQKSAEAGLLNLQNQLTDLQKKLDREYQSASQVRVENGQLKDALTEAEAKVQKSEEQAQAYYDQGFSEATDSLLLQLKGECNKYFVQGWHKALDNAEVDDASELYDLAWRHQPFGDPALEERNEEAGEDAVEDLMIPVSHEVLSKPVLG